MTERTERIETEPHAEALADVDRPLDEADASGRELARSPIPAHGDRVVPPTGQATGAGGGYGVGSGRASSGGSGDAGEAAVPAGADPETEWLRSEPTGDDE